MKYVALLRGVNVGGNGTIKMAEIKKSFEKAGFTNVRTYINSGNIIFSSNVRSVAALTKQIENIFVKEFFAINTIVLTQASLKKVAEKIPTSWTKDDVRKYVCFLRPESKPQDVLDVTSPKEGIDTLDVGPQVVYMTTKISGLTKSHIGKIITQPIYKKITIRNFNTVQKLLTLLEA